MGSTVEVCTATSSWEPRNHVTSVNQKENHRTLRCEIVLKQLIAGAELNATLITQAWSPAFSSAPPGRWLNCHAIRELRSRLPPAIVLGPCAASCQGLDFRLCVGTGGD